HDTILAEESGLSEGTFDPRLPMEARLMWYIDPLDGTNNFAHGNPYYCVSIAYGDETGGIYSAAVYQPFTKLMFSADKGEGAYCNGERIKLSSEPKKFEEGAYSTGWASSKGRELDEIGENVMRVQKACTSTAVRMNGAAALDMAFTAWSVFDGFWERNLNPWDTAAGSLIIEEAGGVGLNEKGERFNCRRDLFVVAGHPSIVAKLLKLVARPKS
ncbi:MAG: inositol monophosphatase family protein, partial [Bdellovibrionia bacterium]